MAISIESQSKCMVLVASLFVTTFVFGLLFTFGSLFNAISDKFHENRSRTAAVHGLLVGVSLSTGVLSGILISRLGILKIALTGAICCPLGLIMAFFADSILQLYVCIGVITGFGTSLLFISSTTSIGQTFTGPQRLLVLAIQNSSISLAGIVLPYILNRSVDTYGLNGTFLLVGAIHLNSIPAAMIMGIAEKGRHAKQPEHHFKTGTDISTGRRRIDEAMKALQQEVEILKKNVVNVFSIPYLLNFLAVGIVIASLNGYMSLILDILKWKGISESDFLLAYPVTYGVGLVARLLPGLLKQFKGVNSLVLPIVYSICGCAGHIIICLLPSLNGVLIGCGLSGIAVSGVISAANIVVVQIVGNENMAIGIGLINTAIGVLSAITGPIYGFIRDTGHSYSTVLLLTAGSQIGGAFLFAAAIVFRRMAKLKHSTDVHYTRTAEQSGDDEHVNTHLGAK